MSHFICPLFRVKQAVSRQKQSRPALSAHGAALSNQTKGSTSRKTLPFSKGLTLCLTPLTPRWFASDATNLLADSLTIAAEPSENLDVTRNESDIIGFLRGGELTPAPFTDNDPHRMEALKDGAAFELDAERDAYLMTRATLCDRLRDYLSAVEADDKANGIQRIEI